MWAWEGMRLDSSSQRDAWRIRGVGRTNTSPVPVTTKEQGMEVLKLIDHQDLAKSSIGNDIALQCLPAMSNDECSKQTCGPPDLMLIASTVALDDSFGRNMDEDGKGLKCLRAEHTRLASRDSNDYDMKAVIWNGTAAELVNNRPPPRLRPDYLLVSTIAVALNPTDVKAIAAGRAATNGLLGCDFSGVVLEIGPAVTKPFSKGDRVFGFAHGANFNEAEDGAWADVIAAKGDCCMRMPEGWSFEEAATVGASAITCGQGLFQEMQLRLPRVDEQTVEGGGGKESILIYGGSSSAGTLAIQYARLAGYTVITTCSPRNFDLCKSRGADAVFDYNDPHCGARIHEYTQGQLKLVWDTIGSSCGVKTCMEALTDDTASDDKRYGTILFNGIPRKDVKHSFSVLVTFAGEAFDKFGRHYPASKENFEFAKMFTRLTEVLASKGKLLPHPTRLISRGLQGMLEEGVPLANEGKVSGFKIVARIRETA